jgi:molybdopterin converting factor small subunit
MPKLRLFANLREAAGAAEVEVPGGTVAEVLANAADRFGERFERGLRTARVWVNGDRAEPDTPVSAEDEVALIPPVSGGTSVVRSPVGMEIGLILLLAATLLGANAASLKWFAVAVVLVGSVWAYDLTDFASRRGFPVPIGPTLLGIAGGVLATYRFGIPGMAAATVGAALAAMIWSVMVPALRAVETVAGSAVLAMVAAFGASSMVLLRLRTEDEATAFLVVAVVAVIATWVTGQAQIAGLDPMVAGILAALLTGLVAATVWAEEVLPVMVASLAGSIALVAGRNMGSLLRAGGFYMVGPVPGSLHGFDAIMMAAGPFWLVLTAFG